MKRLPQFKIDSIPESGLFGVYERREKRSFFNGDWDLVADFKTIEEARKWAQDQRKLPEYIG